MDQSRIRNFCIVAHIDHGKSTLADRMLETTGTLGEKQMQAQVLDNMDLERERGITIKAHAVRMAYTAADGTDYIFNLIDTPGHVDFTYEVSRSLAACEGAVLVVDATQGVEAQTVSNLLLALNGDLSVVSCANKIDVAGADVAGVHEQILDLVGDDEVFDISAKTGIGIEPLLEAIVDRVPAPAGDTQGPLRALVFDSLYDQYRGVICFIRVVDGSISKGQTIRFHSTGLEYEIEELGIMRLDRIPTSRLEAGEVGYLMAGIKELSEAGVGDTVVASGKAPIEALSGYQPLKPMVFSGLYPVIADEHEAVREALDRLQLNDAAFTYEPESSPALGFGFRCGFLGLLHMEIVQERLDREHNVDIITTQPNVRYEVLKKNGEVIEVENPSNLPTVVEIDEIREPILDAQILVPSEYIGSVMQVCNERRGTYINTEYLAPGARAILHYELPLAEVVIDFYDRLKSVSRGYASFDYDHKGMTAAPLVRLDILINGECLDALAAIIHRDRAFEWGKRLCAKLKELIPRQMFEVIIQAAIGSKVISRETVRPFRKNVTAKCYGGDVSRKRKLLERQKEGKKRMKQFANVEIPQEAFLAALKIDE